MATWKILVVDDEEGIHGITRMIFRGYEFEQRPIELISAMSGAEARQKLLEHTDIALVLLDVVMETDHAGLQLVEHIRGELNNHDVRIILRTGHPGYAPEAQVIVNYDINDYLSKAELSASRLLTSVVVALRSYRDIRNARIQQSSSSALLPAAHHDGVLTESIQERLSPLLRQSQRLEQMSLNPVAKDAVTNLSAAIDRLAALLDLANTPASSPERTRFSPSQLMDDILGLFLPESRQNGWLLDYVLDPSLATSIEGNYTQLRCLIVGIVELALLSADGNDLRIMISPDDEGSWRVSLELTSGHPVFSQQRWADQLQYYITQSISQNGLSQGIEHILSVDDQGAIHCKVPV